MRYADRAVGNQFFIVLDCSANDLNSLSLIKQLLDGGLLVLKLLIHNEKVHNFIKNVRRKLVDRFHSLICGI